MNRWLENTINEAESRRTSFHPVIDELRNMIESTRSCICTSRRCSIPESTATAWVRFSNWFGVCAPPAQSQPNLSSGRPHCGQGVRSRPRSTLAMWHTGQYTPSFAMGTDSRNSDNLDDASPNNVARLAC